MYGSNPASRPVRREQFVEGILCLAVLHGHSRLKVAGLYRMIADAYQAFAREEGFTGHPLYRPFTERGVRNALYSLETERKLTRDFVDTWQTKSRKRLEGSGECTYEVKRPVFTSITIHIPPELARDLLGGRRETYERAAAKLLKAWSSGG